MSAWYFGAYQGAGHYCFDTSLRETRGCPIPASKLDGQFLPKSWDTHTLCGLARTTLVGDYTILAFWDRSHDLRPGSNSAFIIQGHHAPPEALRLARLTFPGVFEALRCEVRLESV